MIANLDPQPAPHGRCPRPAAARPSGRARATDPRRTVRTGTLRPAPALAADRGGITGMPRELVPYIGPDAERIRTRTCTGHRR